MKRKFVVHNGGGCTCGGEDIARKVEQELERQLSEKTAAPATNRGLFNQNKPKKSRPLNKGVLS
ncbi:hypothetical protein [Wenzhouxiangella sp. EGI_FJ10409]|uniref:hypothetical protein n=1 Tax=Wenzhouxiangella sp. EGI_FJ10409 TaxID=3243767 RepID=UPI0035DD3B36